jgi:hypothetical protein
VPLRLVGSEMCIRDRYYGLENTIQLYRRQLK